MKIRTHHLLLLLLLLQGCSVVSNNRVFPKLTWYWQWEAVAQRNERKASADYARTNQISKDWQGDLQKAIDSKR